MFLILFILLIDIDSSNAYSYILYWYQEICALLQWCYDSSSSFNQDKTENKLFNNIKVQKYPQAMLN